MLPNSRQTEPSEAVRTIHDPTTGETITFIETAEESGGERAVMRLELAPGTVVPPHAHPFEESFECLDGQLSFRLNGRVVELRPGDMVTAPRDVVHGLSNPSQAPVVLRVLGRPGPIAEYSVRIKFLLSRDGYLPTGGGPPRQLLIGAVVLHRAGMYFPPLPRWLFRSLIVALAALGRWRGRERFLLRRHPEYDRFLATVGKK